MDYNYIMAQSRFFFVSKKSIKVFSPKKRRTISVSGKKNIVTELVLKINNLIINYLCVNRCKVLKDNKYIIN